MNCAKHRSENRWAAQAPASPDLEVEAVHESVSELALPVDVRPGGDTAESNRRDDLTPRDLLTHARVDGARVVVAGLQVAGVLHADAEPADGDPPVRRHDRSEEHTSELQSHSDLVCRLLLEKKNTKILNSH